MACDHNFTSSVCVFACAWRSMRGTAAWWYALGLLEVHMQCHDVSRGLLRVCRSVTAGPWSVVSLSVVGVPLPAATTGLDGLGAPSSPQAVDDVSWVESCNAGCRSSVHSQRSAGCGLMVWGAPSKSASSKPMRPGRSAAMLSVAGDPLAACCNDALGWPAGPDRHNLQTNQVKQNTKSPP